MLMSFSSDVVTHVLPPEVYIYIYSSLLCLISAQAAATKEHFIANDTAGTCDNCAEGVRYKGSF